MGGKIARFSVLTVVFSLIVFSFVFTQESFALTGTITQEGTSTVLPNINIMVFDPGTPNIPPIYNGMTDTFGQYSITLPPGYYILLFCPSPNGGSYLCEYYNNAANFQNATMVQVIAGVPIIADAALTKAQTLSGTITQEGTSTVLPNINIMVFDPSTPNTPPVYSAMTDTFGQYSITLLPGDYQLLCLPFPQRRQLSMRVLQ